MEKLRNTEHSSMAKLYDSFNVLTNLGRLTADREEGYYQLTYLDFFKGICVLWVLVSNDYMVRYSVSANVADGYSVQLFLESWIYCFLSQATLAFDALLFISGLSSFLIYIHYLETYNRGKCNKSFLGILNY